jgi:hypothetical protein
VAGGADVNPGSGAGKEIPEPTLLVSQHLAYPR